MTTNDRFSNISNDYGELFTEVFAEQGMDYRALELSVFHAVTSRHPDVRKISILDIGVGDGATSAPFIAAGCTQITGIDLNPAMVLKTKEKFGDAIRVLQMNAVDLSVFDARAFDVVMAGAAIHNIPPAERSLFWKELLRLDPLLFVCAEKIKDANAEKHRADYEREIKAISHVYGSRHGLKEAEQEWLQHYQYDEQIALTIDEIEDHIGERYQISILLEMGLYKTILAERRS